MVNQGNQRYYIQVAYDMTSEEKQTQEFNSLRNIPDSFKKIGFIRLRVLERVQVEELNKCTPHSRYFSDELGVQFF